MGGNLYRLGRLPKDRYLKIESSVSAYLDTVAGLDYKIPKYYGDKADFGDLDIIVTMDDAGLWESTRRRIVHDLGIDRFQSNGPVFSTVYENFQVDYFYKEKETFLTTYHFMCYNDLGNLLGKIFRRFNLKYGEHGLSWVFRFKDGNYKKEILLTRDSARMFRFLELDDSPWRAGFENLEAMFAWLMASPYFSVAPYVDKDKKILERAKVRPTIARFMDFVEKNQITRRYDYLEDKTAYLEQVAGFFPEVDLPEQVRRLRQMEAETMEIRQKFNGRLVMSWLPQLTGKSLGAFIQSYKDSHDEFDSFILGSPVEQVKQDVVAYYKRTRR